MTINNDARPYGFCNWNEYNLNPLTRNNWRASLVRKKQLNALLTPATAGSKKASFFFEKDAFFWLVTASRDIPFEKNGADIRRDNLDRGRLSLFYQEKDMLIPSRATLE